MKERSAIILDSGRLVQWRTGGAAHVDFDWTWAMKREETKGDVTGFFHTHPSGFSEMSDRDRRTMQAWSVSFGKPLICAIGCRRDVRLWICDGDGNTHEATKVGILKKKIQWKK